MYTVILLSIGLVFIAFLMFSLRILLVKNGTFRGTCANNNPMLVKEGATCGVCGRKPGEECADNKA
ncbi:MAG: hypothetical protein R2792_10480 [Saprospiraceae bacterium]|jgi:hypothetical protein